MEFDAVCIRIGKTIYNHGYSCMIECNQRIHVVRMVVIPDRTHGQDQHACTCVLPIPMVMN